MPRLPKYPLKPLLEHRDRHVVDATAGLARAVEAREAADEARARLEGERREAEERAARESDAERARLAAGELRAADLARSDAWELGVRLEAEALAHRAEGADAKRAAAREAEEAARTELARAKSDRDAVAKDHARFADRVRRAADAAEEDEAGDAQRRPHKGDAR